MQGKVNGKRRNGSPNTSYSGNVIPDGFEKEEETGVNMEETTEAARCGNKGTETLLPQYYQRS